MNRRGFIRTGAMVVGTTSGCQFGGGRVGVTLLNRLARFCFRLPVRCAIRDHHPLCCLLFVATANNVESVIAVASVNRIAVFDKQQA